MKDLIKKYDIFQSLSPSDLSILARAAMMKELKKGEYLCHEGEKATHLYLLTQGKLKVVKHTSFGKDVILDIYAKGEMFLMEGVFDAEPQPASAVAAEDSMVLLIEKRTFVRVMDQNPMMTRAVLSEMAHKMRGLTDQITDLSVGKVDYRIANLMLKLGHKIGEEEGDQVKLNIHLSRQDIADLTGTTIETAIRTMSRLAKQEVVKTTKDSILILDRHRLEDIAAGF
ncbi:MAG: Crp/Fnr family transcriptional regulator [Myxococcales bacterium]|nr:MAG: Crp/Fnr family transcriptional regulator [Myxococcales bacterium]